MTREEAIEMLELPKRKAAQLRIMSEKREELLALLFPGAPRGERVQKSREDRTARIMAEVMDLEARMDEVQRERVEAMIRLRRLLDGDDLGTTVLSLFYICGKSMKEIGEMFELKGTYVYQIREAGLELFLSSARSFG